MRPRQTLTSCRGASRQWYDYAHHFLRVSRRRPGTFHLGALESVRDRDAAAFAHNLMFRHSARSRAGLATSDSVSGSVRETRRAAAKPSTIRAVGDGAELRERAKASATRWDLSVSAKDAFHFGGSRLNAFYVRNTLRCAPLALAHRSMAFIVDDALYSDARRCYLTRIGACTDWHLGAKAPRDRPPLKTSHHCDPA